MFWMFSMRLVMPAMFTDENLHALVVCRMVSLSLEHGNSDASCFAYVSLSMLAGPHFGNYEAGFSSASWATIWWKSTGCIVLKLASICVLAIASCHGGSTSRQGASCCDALSTPPTGWETSLLLLIVTTIC